MSNALVAVAFVVCLVFAGILAMVPKAPVAPAAPGPSGPVVPADATLVAQLRAAMVGEQARPDALALADGYDGLSDLVVIDGQQPEPRIKTAAAAGELMERVAIVAAHKFGGDYPGLSAVVSAYAHANVGKENEPLDATRRGRFVAALRSLASSLRGI